MGWCSMCIPVSSPFAAMAFVRRFMPGSKTTALIRTCHVPVPLFR